MNIHFGFNSGWWSGMDHDRSMITKKSNAILYKTLPGFIVIGSVTASGSKFQS